MSKWTSQQKFISIGSVIGAAAAVSILTLTLTLGVDNTLTILKLSKKIGSDKTIKVLQNASNVVINISEFKRAI
ncbi:MAG: hypothetical protein JJE17_03750 [Peptostreptococcaceae bacterium]|nr:hypothetical protein [Peptostreptococcaceae bacterium]